MKRALSLLAVGMLIWACAAAPAQAYCPQGWVYVNGAYAYSQTQTHWFYLNPAQTMRCYDYVGGTWNNFPAAFSGWVYFDWPHGYRLATGRWYYFNAADPLVCFNLVDSKWTPFGQVAYSQSDAPGTWIINNVTAYVANQNVRTGRVDVAVSGAFTGTRYTESGVGTAISGSAAVSYNGSVQIDIAGEFDPAEMDLCAGKTHAVSSDSVGTSYSYLYMMSRRGTGYAAANLPGTWMYYQVRVDTSDARRNLGPIVIQGNGAFTAYMDEDGTPQVSTGTATIDSNGIVRFGNGPTTYVTMDMTASKDVLVRSSPEGSGPPYECTFAIALKRAASYTLADAVGTWRFSRLVVGATTQGSERGTICIYPNGTFTVYYVPSSGTPGNEGGPAAMTADGMLTLNEQQFQLNASKTVFATAFTDSSSRHLLVAVRQAE